MRTHLETLLARGLSCGGLGLVLSLGGFAARAQAIDLDRIHLPGSLGRFCGIGYSDGYHARYPSRPQPGHGLPSFQAPAYHAGMIYGPEQAPGHAPTHGPAMSPQGYGPGSGSAPSTEMPAPLQLEPHSAPALDKPSEPIHQPPRDAASPSDRTGFMKRLPSPRVRGESRVTDLPAPPAPPKKASVARSSILELEAR